MAKEIMMREHFYEEEYDRTGYEIVVDGATVGTIEIIDNFNEYNDVCYIERIDIEEAYRNQGIGSKVLTCVLREEFHYLFVVVAPDNADAQRLYERLGVAGYNAYGLDYMDQGYGIYSI
jgi:Acetyltransferases